MTLNITDDLEVIFTSDDGLKEAKYLFNTVTGKSFKNKADASMFASMIRKTVVLMHKPTEEELLQDAKDTKCQEIDSATKKSIISIAGDAVSQSNKQAKSSQLIRKELKGTLSADGSELELLNTLDALFVEVENLIATGNDKEAQIKACKTQAEFDAKCLELGV